MPKPAVFPVLALAGCALSPFADPVTDVRVAQAADVVGCDPTGIYTTTTGVTGQVIQERAIEIARNETLATARADGANTVVFDVGAPGEEALFVRATGYRC